ncbi:MAG: hypothetical protein GKR89_36180 [Candidatus Latescibacteria bacterium]|nr:hypothetical protein [Candidatus Latescibacterota bacterium]
MLAKIGLAVLLVAGLWLALKIVFGLFSMVFTVALVLGAVGVVCGLGYVGWRLIAR